MNILVVNDDGIEASGIVKLAKAALNFGNVTVVAPKKQCSAMSHHITLGRNIGIEEYPFPVDEIKAYAFDGTPADCVRASFLGFINGKDKPDIVLSGVNAGANCGYDILYSATVGAAMEAVLYDVPAICFSQAGTECCLFEGEKKDPPEILSEVLDKELKAVIAEFINLPIPEGNILNINFPNCPYSMYKGIAKDRFPSKQAFWDDIYVTEISGEEKSLVMKSKPAKDAEEGSDVRALMGGYISSGYVPNPVLFQREVYGRK